jgi:tRNA(fMet)-specific endonuclease VapC
LKTKDLEATRFLTIREIRSKTVEALDLSDDAAIHYAEIRADLKKRGTMIGANDLFSAAHARSQGLTLVTNNTAEFERVEGLAIENWTLPPPA